MSYQEQLKEKLHEMGIGEIHPFFTSNIEEVIRNLGMHQTAELIAEYCLDIFDCIENGYYLPLPRHDNSEDFGG